MRNSKKTKQHHMKHKTRKCVYTDEARRIMREIKRMKSIQSRKKTSKYSRA